MSELIVATGDSVARIEGDGETWQAVLGLEGSCAQCLAVDPLRPGTVYAGCRGRGVWRSHDGGRAWEDCRLPAPDVFSLAVSPAGDRKSTRLNSSHIQKSRMPSSA